MERIAIIGLGRVGASLGLALRRWMAAPENEAGGRRGIEVVGFDFEPELHKRAERLGAVNRAYWKLDRLVADAGLVVLAREVGDEREALGELAPLLAEGTVVTDIGPLKRQALAWAEERLPTGAPFVAGHAVVPSGGDEPPDAGLFADRTWALFPSVSADEAAVELVVGMVQAAGARPYFPDPLEHDAQIAATATLPALAVAALLRVASGGGGERDLEAMRGSDLATLAPLVAPTPSALAAEVLLGRAETLRRIDELRSELVALRALAASDEPDAPELLSRYLGEASAAREGWLRPSREDERPPREGIGAQVNRMLLGRRRRDQR